MESVRGQAIGESKEKIDLPLALGSLYRLRK